MSEVSPENANPAPKPPTHRAWRLTKIFENGIGWVIIARYKAGGRRVEAGVFLVDVQCLGVKNAHYEDTTDQDFCDRILGHSCSCREIPLSAIKTRRFLRAAVEFCAMASDPAKGPSQHPPGKGHRKKPWLRNGGHPHIEVTKVLVIDAAQGLANLNTIEGDVAPHPNERSLVVWRIKTKQRSRR